MLNIRQGSAQVQDNRLHPTVSEAFEQSIL